MKTKLNINGKEVEITLTKEQVQQIKSFEEDITKVIEDFKDACNYLNIKTYGDAYKLLGMKRQQLISTSIENCEDSYLRLCIYTLALNEGKSVDPKTETMYFSYFDHNKKPGSGFFDDDFDIWCGGRSIVSSRLALRTSKLAMYSGQQFEQEHYDYMYN